MITIPSSQEQAQVVRLMVVQVWHKLSYPWGIITDADGNVYVGGVMRGAEVGSGSGDTAVIEGLIVQFDGAERVKTDQNR